MHSGSKANISAAMLRVQLVLEAARDLQCDHVTRLQLLFALLEKSDAQASKNGMSIAVLADRVALPLEAARHAIRALRVDGHVCLAGRVGKTEFFKLVPTSQQKLMSCLSDLDKIDSAVDVVHTVNGPNTPA